jgi:hypothetical protein
MNNSHLTCCDCNDLIETGNIGDCGYSGRMQCVFCCDMERAILGDRNSIDDFEFVGNAVLRTKWRRGEMSTDAYTQLWKESYHRSNSVLPVS